MKIVSKEIMEALKEFAGTVMIRHVNKFTINQTAELSKLLDIALEEFGVALPKPDPNRYNAAKCLEMGLMKGDAIITDDSHSYRRWHQSKMELLWMGERVVVWKHWVRNSSDEQWNTPIETTDVDLCAHEWVKVT